MNQNRELLDLAKRVQALSENGLHYAEGDYDLDRYRELESIAMEMMQLLTGKPMERIREISMERNGYRTPKIDVRSVIFNDRNEILMVQEKLDNRWSMPGGWCDVGYSAKEVAEKEAFEEAGIRVKATKILALLDKRMHKHPADLNHAYKIFMECRTEDYSISTGMETMDVGFFGLDQLPELSTPRNTREQIALMFAFRQGQHNWPLCD